MVIKKGESTESSTSSHLEVRAIDRQVRACLVATKLSVAAIGLLCYLQWPINTYELSDSNLTKDFCIWDLSYDLSESLVRTLASMTAARWFLLVLTSFMIDCTFLFFSGVW